MTYSNYVDRWTWNKNELNTKITQITTKNKQSLLNYDMKIYAVKHLFSDIVFKDRLINFEKVKTIN